MHGICDKNEPHRQPRARYNIFVLALELTQWRLPSRALHVHKAVPKESMFFGLL